MEFIKKYNLKPSIEFDIKGDIPLEQTFEYKYAIKVAERFDSAIEEEICKIAAEEGITDLYLLNKETIVDALRKQIAVEPDNDGYHKTCPRCGNPTWRRLGSKYCDICGQRIQFEKEE